MNIRLNRDEVVAAMISLQQIVPPKTTLPILSNFLLRAEEDRLYLAATDLDISIRTSVTATVMEPGSTTVPARKFSEIIRELPEEEFQLDESEDRITLSCGKGQYKLTGMDWEEFPRIQEEVEGPSLKIDGEQLRRMVAGTTFAVSADETRPALGGVLWKISGQQTTMVSTDGHRLALIALQGAVDGSTAFSGEMIVPPKALHQLTRLTGEGKQLKQITVGEKYLQAEFDNTVLLSRLVEGPYPNYELVIPRDNDKRMVLDRDRAVSAVRRVAVLSNAQTHQVKFNLEETTGMLSAVSPDMGAEAREQIELHYEGTPMEVAYNAQYLLEILRHIPEGEVEFTFKTPTSAGLIRPVAQVEGEELTFLLMPLRLND